MCFSMYKVVYMFPFPLMSTDIKVKIVTIPEDQLREAGEAEGEGSVSERTRDSDLSAAMSKLLDSLLVSIPPSSAAFSNGVCITWYSEW